MTENMDNLINAERDKGTIKFIKMDLEDLADDIKLGDYDNLEDHIEALRGKVKSLCGTDAQNTCTEKFLSLESLLVAEKLDKKAVEQAIKSFKESLL